MKAPALGEAVTHLPWLAPSAASLAALTRAPAVGVWEHVRYDPAAVLLIARYSHAAAGSSHPCNLARGVHDPAVLEGALRHLHAGGAGFLDWTRPELRPIYDTSLAYASVARNLAQRTGHADPDQAWVAGLLAPFGWLAVAAMAPEQAAGCLAELSAADDVEALQQQQWGFDGTGIARRLCRRWQLPGWLEAVTGHLALPTTTAVLLGADADLFRVVQLAVELVQQHGGHSLRLRVGVGATVNAPALGIMPGVLEEIVQKIGSWIESGPANQEWERPEKVPLLGDLLRLAIENRRLSEAPVLSDLEQDIDQLHRALRDQQTGEEVRLRDMKLRALAEFAGGAGHEINNPLAVISGQAQYLLNHETEPARQKALQAIITQTQRIHGLLHGLMQFARPPRLHKEPVDLAVLVQEVMESVRELAEQRHVQLVHGGLEQPISGHFDVRYVRTALAGLMRNAIEAAPADGWARVRLEATAQRIDCIVEDSGHGPASTSREHLFDPFYSGRQAGRGRGLGLSTAWRLAREHGGEVRFDPQPGAPSRFVLSLPRDDAGSVLPVTSTAESPVTGSAVPDAKSADGAFRAYPALDAAS